MVCPPGSTTTRKPSSRRPADEGISTSAKTPSDPAAFLCPIIVRCSGRMIVHGSVLSLLSRDETLRLRDLQSLWRVVSEGTARSFSILESMLSEQPALAATSLRRMPVIRRACFKRAPIRGPGSGCTAFVALFLGFGRIFSVARFNFQLLASGSAT